MKIGVEVEGRLKGLWTLFLTVDELKCKREVWARRLWMVQQVYISDLSNKLDLAKDQDVFCLQADNRYITVERTKLSGRPPDHLNIILRVDNPSLWYLRESDQIKFESEKHVWMFVAELGIRTAPAAYRKDEVFG